MTAKTPYKDTPLAAIFSLEGLMPTDNEITCFEQARPLGFILFKRNIESPDQLLRLTQHLKEIVGWNCPILIDQEGAAVDAHVLLAVEFFQLDHVKEVAEGFVLV